MVGFTSRIPGTNDLLNALFWSKDVDPQAWQPHTTAFARLAAAGVHTTVVNKRDFQGSGLTIAGHRGADFVGADRVGERIAAVQQASAQRPSVTYMYDGDLDWTGHRYGVDSPHWEQQLAMIDAAAEHLRETLPSTHPDPRGRRPRDGRLAAGRHRIDTDDAPQLLDGVHLLGGEARFRHVYCRSGAVDDVVATWRATLGGPGRGADPRGRDRRAAGWVPSTTPYAPGWATSWSPAATTSRSCRPRCSPTRPPWSGCTAR